MPIGISKVINYNFYFEYIIVSLLFNKSIIWYFLQGYINSQEPKNTNIFFMKLARYLTQSKPTKVYCMNNEWMNKLRQKLYSWPIGQWTSNFRFKTQRKDLHTNFLNVLNSKNTGKMNRTESIQKSLSYVDKEGTKHKCTAALSTPWGLKAVNWDLIKNFKSRNLCTLQ